MAEDPRRLIDDAIADLPGKIVVTGVDGQVGSALVSLLGDKAIPLTQSKADFRHPQALEALLDQLQPAIVLNPAAYTAVDKAEEEEALATTINAEAPAAIARWCAAHKVPMVHYSTDYVFPGTGTAPWKEEDETGPQNAYGRGKLAGEQAVLASGAHALIFRTSWVYDAHGRNFLNTMLRLGKEKPLLSIVDDQIGAPTYAPHLAALTIVAVAKALKMDAFPTGMYHTVNNGETSWYQFASAIFAEAHKRHMPMTIKTVRPVDSKDFPTPAARPCNSRLAMGKLERVFGLKMPEWQAGMREAMDIKAREMATIKETTTG